MEKGTEVWVCGCFIQECEHGNVWEVHGVYSTEELAVKACNDEYYFIGPLNIDEALPDSAKEWPRCYYPIGEMVIEVQRARNEK
jgi:hypothetical protein